MAQYRLLQTVWQDFDFLPVGTVVGDGTAYPLTGAPSRDIHDPLDISARDALDRRDDDLATIATTPPPCTDMAALLGVWE